MPRVIHIVSILRNGQYEKVPAYLMPRITKSPNGRCHGCVASSFKDEVGMNGCHSEEYPRLTCGVGSSSSIFIEATDEALAAYVAEKLSS